MMQWLKKYQLYIALFVLALGAGWGAYRYIDSTLQVPVPQVGVNVDEKQNDMTDVVEPEQPIEVDEGDANKLRCPLDGAVLMDLTDKRPLAVMIDNSPAARPPLGIDKADLVYEALVEGGITRLMAVFYHDKAAEVGPIRSARPYFVQLAQDTKSVYVHAGQSPQAATMFKEKGIAHLNEIPITRGFWRVTDRVRPHNLLSSTDKLHNLAEDYNLEKSIEVPAFPFYNKQPELPETLRNSDEIIIYYPQQFSQVRYVYHEDSGEYLRFMGEKAHIDGSNNLQLKARNIVVQYVDTKVIDGEGRLEMNMTGKGKAMVFNNGIAYQARWEKDNLSSPTRYYTVKGEEIKFMPGQTWIQIVPTDTRVDY
ncbi:DUF3048 domain-containing protein [Metallumcola ferriviriculae]|uniref:DUF3048 domain-containing protein n=1 Tax=Metallumcola ferriviriculae TaxID=3039180 RepID=A0AAU0ULW4_9FIRM|nr:DUF3048 domain-containing protein [Desulfitibacteraceae bacterium MK1]